MTRRKVLVTLDDALLRRLDRAAQQRGVTRSALLATLTQRELQRKTPEQLRGIDAALEAIQRLGTQHGTDGENAAATVRRMRDERSNQLTDR